MKIKIQFLSVCLLLSNLLLSQTPGSIDLSFNTASNYVQLSGANNFVQTSLQQPDGYVIIGGSFTFYNGEATNYLSRIYSNGIKDLSFNIGTGPNATVSALALQNDGKVIIGGGFTTYNGIASNKIARLNVDGSYDNSFNIGVGANGEIRAIAVQNDGKIIIGGDFTSFNGTSINRIARLNINGSLDLTFNVGSGASNSIRTCKIQSDGKILIGGGLSSSGITYNGGSSGFCFRLNTNGSMDVNFPNLASAVKSIAIQSDGKIIASYNRYNTNGTLDVSFSSGSPASIAIQDDGKILIDNARYNPDGSIDNSFVLNPLSGSIFTSLIQNNGKYLIGGSFLFLNGVPFPYRIATINTDGSADATFNSFAGANSNINTTAIESSGKVLSGGSFTQFQGSAINRINKLDVNGNMDGTFNIGTGASATVKAIKIQNDGKTLVGGESTIINGNNLNLGIARINTDGSNDLTFTGRVSGNGNIVNTISQQQDGKIIVGGSFSHANYPIQRPNLARLNADGSTDLTFDPGLTPVVNEVYSSAIQTDGKIIIGGPGYNKIARLNANGGVDNTFLIGSGANGTVRNIIIQPDGKIIVSGDFTSFNGTACNRIVRLNIDGSVDNTFLIGLGANNVCTSTAIQFNGKIIVVGKFTSFNGVLCNRIVRLNADGTVDLTFDSGVAASSDINSVSIQNDGKIIIGGVFHSYQGIAKSRIARLYGDCTIPSAPTGLSAQILCNGATIADLSVIGNDVQWYSSSVGGSPLGQTSTLVDGNSYYASQNNITCESVSRFEVVAIVNNSSSGTDTQTACESFTWIDGNTYTSNNNTATYYATNYLGCDSVITLNLTINNQSTGIDIQSSCDSYTWIDGNTYTYNNNSATYILPSSNGCDSIVTLNLTISNTPLASISLNQVTFTASPFGMNYQWIDCNNGNSEIFGETNQIFTPTSNGNYAVVVTNDDCSSTSSCIAINTIGINEYLSSNVFVYPNPTNDKFTLNVTDDFIGKAYFVTDFSGRIVIYGKINSLIQTIDMLGLANGSYLFQVNQPTIKAIKLIKQ